MLLSLELLNIFGIDLTMKKISNVILNMGAAVRVSIFIEVCRLGEGGWIVIEGERKSEES